MMLSTTHPIITTQDIAAALHDNGYSRISADTIEMSDDLRHAWDQLRAAYADLPPDNFLPDGGAYRYRRYDSFAFQPATGELRLLPHTNYYQGRDINAVTGGIEREFAPLTPGIAQNAYLQALIRFDFEQFPLSEADRAVSWRVDAHLIRVVAQPGAHGQPTPEGVHRDGAQYVTVHLAELENVTGGVVSVYADDKTPLASFTLQRVGDAYLFRDEALWHGVTPIAPAGSGNGVRSILTFDYHREPGLTV